MTSTPAHARLDALREGLLGIHKTLLAIARAEYEGASGPVGSPGALLQLLLNDATFAWLRPVSALAARADELLDEDEIADADVAVFVTTAVELLTPDENGTGFAKRYFDALQASPDVVIAHVQVQRLLAPPR